MKHLLFLILVILSIVVVACGGNSAPSPTVAATTNAPAPTEADVQPTNAPAPTQAAPTSAPQAAQTASSPTSAATAAATTGSQLEPPTGDPYDIIKNATLAQLQSKSFRATTSVESADGTKTQILIEYVAPGSIHVNLGHGEQIAIKDKGAWIKNGDKWEAAPPGMENLLFAMLSPESIQAILKNIQVSSVRFVGPDVLDGKPMFVYQYDTLIDLGSNQSIKGTSKAWIGALDHRAYRVESLTDSVAKPGAQDKTTATYEYDIPITIEPPI